MWKKTAVFTFFVIIMLGMIFQVIGREHELHGVSEETPLSVSAGGLWAGSSQSDMEAWLDGKLVLRTWLIPIRNQIVYSVFHTSTNDEVVLGKNGNLFEERYLTAETQITPPVGDEDMEALAERIKILNDRLEEKGKSLFIFITPSKAHVYSEDIPDLYLKLAPDTKEVSSYSKLIQKFEEKGIAYFDSVPYVLELKENAEYPVYTKTGVHWSRVAALEASGRLMDEMERQLSINLPEIAVDYLPTSEAIEPDRDLEELLNIWKGQDLDFYAPSITVTDEEKDSVRLLARGGSFMQTSIMTLTGQGYFDSYFYMENTLLVDDGEISYFSEYEELDLDAEIEQADIVLLEVNEEAVDRMSFGFIDYMLDNILVD